MDIATLIEPLLEILGEAESVALAGLVVGLVFGVAAQKSAFCLRAGVVEFARGTMGPRLSVWLLCFSTALVWTQAAALGGLVELETSRWLSQASTLSGAVIGGLIFGVGMVLARGCPGRLLVLGATGNLRAILSGLVFAVTAQVSLHGLGAPMRDGLAGLAVTDGPAEQITAMAGVPAEAALIAGVALAVFAIWLARRNRIGARTLVFGSGVGFAVALAWYLTYTLSTLTFDPTPVESLTFSGPSADTLMMVLEPVRPIDFDIGLVPGVFLGAFLAAAIGRELAWQGWDGAEAMRRSLTGAALMGFGAMLAGGCSIGAGVAGGSTLALTAWVALTAMWIGGALTDFVVDQPRAQPALA